MERPRKTRKEGARGEVPCCRAPWTERELPARCRVGEGVRAAIVRKKRHGSKIVVAERNGGVGVQNK
jgi:hypothetical protein